MWYTSNAIGRTAFCLGSPPPPISGLSLYCPPKLLTAVLWSCTVWLFPLWEFRPATISGRRQAHVAIISSQFPPRCFLFLLLSWSDAYLMLCDGDADANSAALPVTAKNCQVPVNGFESSWDARGHPLLMAPQDPTLKKPTLEEREARQGLLTFLLQAVCISALGTASFA